MPIEILMPALSPTMTEGTLAKWLKAEGDKIKPGDIIAEIETDKATMEVEAIDEGIIGKILVDAGAENVSVGKLIALVIPEGEDKASLENYVGKGASSKAANSNAVEEQEMTKGSISNLEASKILDKALHSNDGGRIFASPLAKRIASMEGVDLKNVAGSGPHGRIIKDDVLKSKSTAAASLGAQNSVKNSNSAVLHTPLERATEDTIIPITGMRKVIAKRLTESKQTIPHFYLSIECNLDKLMALRQEISQTVKISVNDFIIKASALALRDVPEINASWEDTVIRQYNNVDVAVAVAIDGGLITPIIKNADRKTLSHISSEMKELAQRARDGKLLPHEFQGGGFSISNLGMFKVKKFHAIVNPPQSAILAVGASSERVVVINKQMVIANIVDLTLSCDHRIVDGAVASKFLDILKGYLENPITVFI